MSGDEKDSLGVKKLSSWRVARRVMFSILTGNVNEKHAFTEGMVTVVVKHLRATFSKVAGVTAEELESGFPHGARLNVARRAIWVYLEQGGVSARDNEDAIILFAEACLEEHWEDILRMRLPDPKKLEEARLQTNLATLANMSFGSINDDGGIAEGKNPFLTDDTETEEA
jgi:hypothetical protein